MVLRVRLYLIQWHLKVEINQTSFANSLSESRPLLTGINFKIEDTFMEVIATDSYRLAKKTIS